MKKLMITAALVALCITASTKPAFSQEGPQARIADMTMALDADDMTKEPIERTASYLLWSDAFTCCVELAGVLEPVLLKSIWYYIDVDEEVMVDSTVIRVAQDTWVSFTLTHGGHGWPYGTYRIAVSIDDATSKSLLFTVDPTYPEMEITEVVISSEVNEAGYPIAPATTFQPTIEPVYACVYLYGPAETRNVTARWYQMFEGEDDYLIDEAILEHGETGWLMFSLTPNTPLPAGKYFAEILLDGKSVRKEVFTVK